MSGLRQSWAVDEVNDARRLDGVVRRLCPEVPLAAIMRWLRLGAVRVNGQRASGGTRVRAGDVVAWPAQDVRPQRPPPRRGLPSVQVLYEDAHLMVVQKPAGLACHAGTNNITDSLMLRVEQHLKTQDAPPGHRPGLAQRLDKAVSGVLAVGKDAVTLRALSAAAAAGGLDKTYTALVEGRVRRSCGAIDVPLRVDDQPMGNRPRSFPDPVNGKAALSRYWVQQRGDDCTLLHVKIMTGRTHQIRAHLRWLGHPLAGDARYGDTARNEILHGRYGLGRLFLHAGCLQMLHPIEGTALRFEAPLCADLVRVLAARHCQ